LDNGSSRYLVYGTDWCGFCKKAIELLKACSKEFDFLDLTGDDDYLAEVKCFYDTKTVPVILEISHTGIVRHIGGFSDLKEEVQNEQ